MQKPNDDLLQIAAEPPRQSPAGPAARGATTVKVGPRSREGRAALSYASGHARSDREAVEAAVATYKPPSRLRVRRIRAEWRDIPSREQFGYASEYVVKLVLRPEERPEAVLKAVRHAGDALGKRLGDRMVQVTVSFDLLDD